MLSSPTNPVRNSVKRLYGRMEDNYHIANKKGLLINLKDYYRLNGKCVFESKVFPHTFLLKAKDRRFMQEGEYMSSSPELDRLRKHMSENPKAIWIVKPGENSNRGAGITLCENNQELEVILRAI